MKKYKTKTSGSLLCRALGIFMVVSILISNCGCKQNTKDAADASSEQNLMLYNEKEIGAGAGLKNLENLRLNSKNFLVTYQRDEKSGKFVTLDTEGKVQSETSCKLIGELLAYDIDGQGNIYAVLVEYTAAQMNQKVCVIDSSGKVIKDYGLEKIKTGSPDMPMATDIAIGANGKIYISTYSGIVVLDKSGKLEKKIGKNSCFSIDTDSESNIFTLNREKGKFSLTKIDSTTGKNIWSKILPEKSNNSEFGSNKVRFDNAKNYVCVMDSYGITCFDGTGKVSDKILDFKQYMILTSGYTPTAMDIDQTGNIYILTKGNDKYEITKYDIQSGKHTAKARKAITLAVSAAERWLETAALKFQKVNKDYSIEIKQYDNTQDQDTQAGSENYAKALNTELLTGRGPDIICASKLSFEKYSDKNLLADLGELLQQDKDFNKNNYYTNIFDALKYKDKLFTLPVCVNFSVLAANKKILQSQAINPDSKWTWDDFGKTGQKLPKDKKMFVSMSSKSLLSYMLNGSISNFINETEKKASFDSAEFISLLKTAKQYGDSKIPNDKFNTGNSNYSDIGAVQRGSVVFNPMTVGDYGSYAFLKGMYNNQVKLMEFPSVGEYKGGTFDSDSLFSINNNSKNKAVAWEFLKFLLSDEIQSGDLDGFAVNKQALAKTAKNMMDQTKGGGMCMMASTKDGKDPVTIDAKPLSQQDIDYINSFIEKASVYNRSNSGINNIIDSETTPFFSGEKTAEEVAKVIQNKVSIYLGE